MKLLIAGGGTAGHINPAISIANYVKKQESNSKFLFVGTKAGMEEELVTKQGYDIRFIDIRGFKRSLSFENVKTIFRIFHAKSQAKKLIREFRPDAVICTGGYVSGPVMCAAKSMKVPSLIHEQNVIPGIAVKMSVKYATFVAISFRETLNYIKSKKKCVLTGNPIREELFHVGVKNARNKLGLDERPFLLIFGGSLGADKINETVVSYLKENINKRNYQILFGCGKRNYETVLENIKKSGINLENFPEVNVVDYIDNMDEAMAAADVVVSRAGAITVSEITALGKASVLIPSPNVAHDHQTYNAMALYENEAGLMIKESELTPEVLATKIDKLLQNKTMLEKLSENAKKMGIHNATAKIYDTIKGVL